MTARKPDIADPPGFMTVAEVAAYFRVKDKTVRRWLEQGELQAIRRPGCRIHIHRYSVDAYVERHTKCRDPETTGPSPALSNEKGAPAGTSDGPQRALAIHALGLPISHGPRTGRKTIQPPSKPSPHLKPVS